MDPVYTVVVETWCLAHLHPSVALPEGMNGENHFRLDETTRGKGQRIGWCRGMSDELRKSEICAFLSSIPEDNFRCASIMEKERVLELDEFLYRNGQ